MTKFNKRLALLEQRDRQKHARGEPVHKSGIWKGYTDTEIQASLWEAVIDYANKPK